MRRTCGQVWSACCWRCWKQCCIHILLTTVERTDDMNQTNNLRDIYGNSAFHQAVVCVSRPYSTVALALCCLSLPSCLRWYNVSLTLRIGRMQSCVTSRTTAYADITDHRRPRIRLQNARFLMLSTNLARERLQTDTDLLRIITSTADELSGGRNIDDLQRPWTPKIWVFSDFFRYLKLPYTFQDWTALQSLETD